MPELDAVEMVNDQNVPNPCCISKVEAALHSDSLLVETSQEQTSLAEEITEDGGQVVEEVDNFWLRVSAGQDCVAKWNEDGVWYRAQVAEVEKDGIVLVVFTDYGNSAYVEEGGLVAGVEDIPSGEEKDINLVGATDASDANLLTEKNNIEVADEEIVVEGNYMKSEYAEEARAVKKVEVVEEAKYIVEALPSMSQLVELKIDDFCVACFSEDNVWYNAQVLEVVGEGRYRLLYTDYGNEEVVEAGRIVTSLRSLGGELVDPGVHQQWSTHQTSIEDVEDRPLVVDIQRNWEPTLENIEARDPI